MAVVRAILFDADGVLQHSGSGDLAALSLRTMGLVPENLDTFMRDVFAAERPAMDGRADFAQLLEPVVAKWGAPGTAVALATAWWCSIEPDRELLDLIGRLRRRGFICGLATNQQRYRARYMTDELAYAAVFDRLFYSCQLGFTKPDRRYFEAVVAELRLAPEEILFIDDAEKNVLEARAVGLEAAQFVHPRASGAISGMTALLASFSVVVPESR